VVCGYGFPDLYPDKKNVVVQVWQSCGSTGERGIWELFGQRSRRIRAVVGYWPDIGAYGALSDVCRGKWCPLECMGGHMVPPTFGFCL